MSAELSELKKITKILTLANAEALEKELAKYATTNERKKVWVLINGERMPDELMKNSGLKQSGFYSFMKNLASAELIDTPYGKASKKKIDFVPASWLELFHSEQEDKEKGGKDVKATNNQ